MRTIFIIPLLFILTACGSATPQVTVTREAEVTVTLTPTAIPTASATPTVTFTPTPAFSPEIVASVEADLGGGFTVFGNQIEDPSGNIVPDIHIEIREVEGEGDQYTYQMAEYEFSVNGETYLMPEHSVELTVEDGKLCQSAQCLENGKWVRVRALAPDGITETEHPAYSKMEAMVMWLAETLKFENPNWQDASSPEREQSKERAREILGTRPNSPVISYEGVTYYLDTRTVFDSALYLVDELGVPIRNEQGKVVEVPIGFMCYGDVSGGQSLVGWEESDGGISEIFLDAKLGNISYYGEHETTPFVLTQAEYDEIMTSLTSAN